MTKCWCHFASPESQCQSNLIDSTLDSLVNFHSLGRFTYRRPPGASGPQGKCDCVKLRTRGEITAPPSHQNARRQLGTCLAVEFVYYLSSPNGPGVARQVHRAGVQQLGVSQSAVDSCVARHGRRSVMRQQLRGRPSRVATRDTRRVQPPPKTRDPIYGTPEHKQWRAEFMRRSRGRCEDPRCAAPYGTGRLFADHVVELRDGGAPFDPANGLARCGACHTRKTLTERARRMAKSPEGPQ